MEAVPLLTNLLQYPDAKMRFTLLCIVVLEYASVCLTRIAEAFASSPEKLDELCSVELDSAGVSVSLFNIISKLFNIPLLSVAAFFCLKHIKKCRQVLSNSESLIDVVEKLQLSSVSTALTLVVGIGIFDAMALSLGTLLGLMEISSFLWHLKESSVVSFERQNHWFLCTSTRTNGDQSPDWWGWGYWLSPLTYGYNAIAMNEMFVTRFLKRKIIAPKKSNLRKKLKREKNNFENKPLTESLAGESRTTRETDSEKE
ncbi:MATE efflux family protein [Striga asiatica]|uniref:MATE efflux family protein n=1 Tax=Striga asiatica TaxID=4170 RepID=A0A5A7RCW5_STRAF|nr:MATE efflux family protein [Striga asiatica]